MAKLSITNHKVFNLAEAVVFSDDDNPLRVNVFKGTPAFSYDAYTFPLTLAISHGKAVS